MSREDFQGIYHSASQEMFSFMCQNNSFLHPVFLHPCYLSVLRGHPGSSLKIQPLGLKCQLPIHHLLHLPEPAFLSIKWAFYRQPFTTIYRGWEEGRINWSCLVGWLWRSIPNYLPAFSLTISYTQFSTQRFSVNAHMFTPRPLLLPYQYKTQNPICPSGPSSALSPPRDLP